MPEIKEESAVNEEQELVEGGDQPERPAWLPEKFKTPEDLAKSYSDLEGDRERVVQENVQLRQWYDSQQQHPDMMGQETEGQEEPPPELDEWETKLIDRAKAEAKKELMADIQPFIERGVEADFEQAVYRFEDGLGEALPDEVVNKAKEALNSIPIQQRNPQAIRGLLGMMRSEHEIQQRLKARPAVQAGGRRMVGQWGLSSGSPSPSVPAVPRLTRAERDAARGMGMTEEDYTKTKQEHEAQMNTPVEEDEG